MRHATPDFTTPLRALGYAAFRPGQEDALEALFRHRRLLLVAPTGGGKSLIYQLPATMLPGTTLVISPLIALMKDQVDGLAARGVAATYLASTLTDVEARARLRGIRAGEYKLVYVAPERLPYPGFQDLVRELDCPLVAVDEAHCISQWGHDFRPEYLAVGAFLAKMPRAMVLACTATATPAVRDDIVVQLNLGADTPQVLRGFARPNLALRVATPGSAAEAHTAVDEALEEAIGGPPPYPKKPGAVILYCLSRADAEREAKRLRDAGYRAGWYHAGLPAEHRTEVQRRFMSGDLDVVAATNAFGMGIDRADVRAVIHLTPPDSVEAYYQEVGRAGRDGEDAFGLLVLRAADMMRRRALIERGARDVGASEEWVQHRWSMFQDLLRWAEGGTCRHDGILRYFGDEVETLHGCGRCDVCQRLAEGGGGAGEAGAGRSAEIARAVLAAVRLVNRRLGLKVTVKFLTGQGDDRLVRYGLATRPEFGSLREYPEAWVTQVAQRCVTAGWVDFTEGEYPLLVLTEVGRAVLEGRREARLILPPPQAEPSRRGRAARGSSTAGVRGAARSAAGGAAHPKRAETAAAGFAARFDALRRWRLERARFEGKPAFTIATDRALEDIATSDPATLEALLDCHGIGPQKAAKFGREILDLLSRVRGRAA